LPNSAGLDFFGKLGGRSLALGQGVHRETRQGVRIVPLTAIIIDDSALSRAVLRRGLVKAGFQVVREAPSAEQAVELFEQYRPTLMTMDIVLPLTDGVTAVTQLLSKHPEATVVMCSAMSSREKIIACRNAGVAHFILKPFSVEKVVEVARRAVAGTVPAEVFS
jgi:two-component system, chemotaxis family, chemotaxis protein CheY